MGILSEQEKQELLALAQSSDMRRDCQQLQPQDESRTNDWVDQYIRFLNHVNAFANHQPKKVTAMTGDHFKL